MYEEAEAELGKFLTPVKYGRDRPVSRSGRFTPGAKKTPWYPLHKECGRGSNLVVTQRMTISCPCLGTKPDSSATQSVVTALRYRDDTQLLFAGRTVRVRSGWDAAKLQGGCDVILDNK